MIIKCGFCQNDFTPSRRDAWHCSRKCAKANSAKKWRAENKEKHLAYSSEYYKSNREAASKRDAKWREENKSIVDGYRAAWAAKNPEKNRQIKRDWEKRNPAAQASKAAKRRAAKLQAIPSWYGELDEFVVEEAQYLRAARGNATGVAHHVDHIIPLISDKVCGLHCWQNLRVITATENCSKSNRLIEM